MRGPHEDLESYLEAIDQLRSTINFFKINKALKSSEGVINHANNLLNKAISKLEDEFRQLLANYRFVLCHIQLPLALIHLTCKQQCFSSSSVYFDSSELNSCSSLLERKAVCGV